MSNPITGLDNTTPYGGMYRYIGTNVDNYVSIGGVLFRIIGITSETNSALGIEEGQVKVIKAEPIGGHVWHSSFKSDPPWESSDMYTYLQGSSVLGNTDIIRSG